MTCPECGEATLQPKLVDGRTSEGEPISLEMWVCPNLFCGEVYTTDELDELHDREKNAQTSSNNIATDLSGLD